VNPKSIQKLSSQIKCLNILFLGGNKMTDNDWDISKVRDWIYEQAKNMLILDINASPATFLTTLIKNGITEHWYRCFTITHRCALKDYYFSAKKEILISSPYKMGHSNSPEEFLAGTENEIINGKNYQERLSSITNMYLNYVSAHNGDEKRNNIINEFNEEYKRIGDGSNLILSKFSEFMAFNGKSTEELSSCLDYTKECNEKYEIQNKITKYRIDNESRGINYNTKIFSTNFHSMTLKELREYITKYESLLAASHTNKVNAKA
jgi:hypothetical protein